MFISSYRTGTRVAALSAAPALLGSAVLAQNEGAGTQNATATITGVSAAGVLLIGINGLLTAQRDSFTLNNGNAFEGGLVFSEVYSPLFPQYGLQCQKLAAALGGSDHAATLAKTTPFTAEGTVALIALAAGSNVVAATSLVRNAAGVAGSTLTSANFTVPAGKRARCLAISSGTGDVNATPPTATITDPGTWGSPIIAIARGSGEAASGHIPLHVWAADLAPGTYAWSAVHAIDEGAVMATLVVQQ